MNDLIAFLTARLDEDEWLTRSSMEVALKRTHYRKSMIARCERDLRDIEAKRAIIASATDCLDAIFGLGSLAAEVLRHLVAVYRDHADFREEWRP